VISQSLKHYFEDRTSGIFPTRYSEIDLRRR
jgi:hypothetical protein